MVCATAYVAMASGATALGGERPINLSGGLLSKGHPVGATGLSMIHELALQLRGEAGECQQRHAPSASTARTTARSPGPSCWRTA